MKGINDSWQNISGKIAKLKKDREKLYQQLEKCNDFNTYIKLDKEIASINYHIEVVTTLTKESMQLEKLKTIINANYTTK